MPKITFHDAIPQRAVLPVPQMAEQLVDEPVPSFDDFELVEAGEEEEEEEEEELPRMVPRVIPGTRARDAEGHEWSRVVGPAGGLLVASWHLHRPVDPPGGDYRQARAG